MPGQKFNGTNHEYNAVKLNQNWYPIDSTWGAGHIEGKEFIRSYNEFFFLANTDLLIKTNFPENGKWQLPKKNIYLDLINCTLKKVKLIYKIKIAKNLLFMDKI